MTVNIYIGSNNDTKRLELAKIERILSNNHKGFTLQRVTGYWMGNKESSLQVLIDDEQQRISDTLDTLKIELKQDAIAWQEVTPLHFR
jgi:hypothetical protein